MYNKDATFRFSARFFVYLLNIKTVMMMMMTRRTTTATIAPAMILTCILSSSPT